MSSTAGGTGSNYPNTNTMKQTIVAHLEAPRLKGTTTKDMNAFLRARELYEKQIEEKNGLPGVDVSAVTYRASIDDSFLRMFVTFGWVTVSNIAEIPEDEVKSCIKTRASRKPKDHELGRVENVVSCVKMDQKMPLLEDRVCHLIQHYLQVLENAGMQSLPVEKPHLAIKHIMKRLKPLMLYQVMRDICEWRKDEHFHKKDFGAFVQ